MGNNISGHVQYADLDGTAKDSAGRPQFYADVRIRSTFPLTQHVTKELGLAMLARHSGQDALVLEGKLTRAEVFEIKPPWHRGQHEFLVTYRDN